MELIRQDDEYDENKWLILVICHELIFEFNQFDCVDKHILIWFI